MLGGMTSETTEFAEALAGLKPQQVEFVKGILEGLSDVAAYMKAHNCTRSNAESNAWRMKENEGVKEALKAARAEVASGVVLSLREKRAFLRLVVVTPISDVDEHSILCQEWTHEVSGGSRGRLRRGQADRGNEVEEEEKTTVKVKMPGKLDAIRLDAQLAGELSEGASTPELKPYSTPLALKEAVTDTIMDLFNRRADVEAARLALQQTRTLEAESVLVVGNDDSGV
jgi:hypothetical protein